MRRVIWNIYAWPITLLLVTVAAVTLVSRLGLLSLLDTAISLPSLVALHLHIWDKRFLSARFWKPYAFVFPLWDLLFNLLLEPMHSGEPFDPWSLIIPVILLPLYIGVFRYAFRNWGGDGLPNNALEPTATASNDPLRYAGFWPRLGALLLDFLIQLPLLAICFWSIVKYRLFNLYSIIPSTLFGLFYSVYLVRRYGGTPGKLIAGVCIRKLGGEPVGYREAFLRYSPNSSLDY